MGIVPKVDVIDLTLLEEKKASIRKKLNEKYAENVAYNNRLRKEYEDRKTDINIEVGQKNEALEILRQRVERCKSAYNTLHGDGCENLPPVKQWIANLAATITENITADYPPEPTYIEPRTDDKELIAVDAEIAQGHETNGKASTYNSWLKAKQSYEQSQQEANEADAKVKAIEAERLTLIKSANMPEGFTFDEDGILFNGLPFSRNQQASSAIYIAALKLAEMTLGEIKTLHFDASFLDNISLKLIQDWAKEKDLQLLIERPDLDGGEIEYQIIAQ